MKPGINLPIEDNRQVIGVVGITGNPDEVGPFGEIIKMTVEMMLQQQFLLKEIDLERQAKENFIHDLISGRIGNDTDLFIARGQIVGYNITLPRVALIINIYRFEKKAQQIFQEHSGLKEGEIYLQRVKNDVLRTIRELFKKQPQDIVAYAGGDRFVVLKIINLQDTDEAIREKLIDTSQKIKNAILAERRFHASIGVGEYHPGIRGIVRSYHEACKALDIGDKIKSDIDIHHISHLRISRLLAEVDPELRKDFIEQILHKKDFSPRKNPILWETLQAFFGYNLNITDTAKNIYIHRNTLLYRLSKIKDLTGLDPRRFDQALQLYIALKMNHFLEE